MSVITVIRGYWDFLCFSGSIISGVCLIQFQSCVIVAIYSLQERQRKIVEEQRNLLQDQAQREAQARRQEDDLARKRMQVLAK